MILWDTSGVPEPCANDAEEGPFSVPSFVSNEVVDTSFCGLRGTLFHKMIQSTSRGTNFSWLSIRLFNKRYFFRRFRYFLWWCRKGVVIFFSLFFGSVLDCTVTTGDILKSCTSQSFPNLDLDWCLIRRPRTFSLVWSFVSNSFKIEPPSWRVRFRRKSTTKFVEHSIEIKGPKNHLRNSSLC